MKTKIFIFGMALAYTAMCALVGCSKSGNTQRDRSVGDTLTLNVIDYPGIWTDSIWGNQSQCESGGFWTGTYGKGEFQLGDFLLSHSSSAGIYSYWDGFTTGANGDSLCYSGACWDSCRTSGCTPDNPACKFSGSSTWIPNQFGVMAGGGLTSNPPDVKKGNPYLLAYWGYYMETTGHSLQISLADGSLFSPQSIWICNHPWPYWGNIYGDGFARPFGPGDYFYLIIHAIKAGGREDSIVHPLAVYGRVLDQSPDWKKVDLTSLFSYDNDSIQSLYFTMKTTDEDPQWGPNTAVYFCLDKLKVVKQEGTALSGAPVTKASTAKPAAKGLTEVKDCFPLASYTGGEVLVHDAEGNEVLKTTVKAGQKPDLSKLPEGEYRLRHGHRHIPFKKVK